MDLLLHYFADPSVCLQGTNGSQLWDTAFAVQAFIEVIIIMSERFGRTSDGRNCSVKD